MASDQFIEEMHDKLHPETEGAAHDIGDLTIGDVEEVMAIIDDKHAVKLSSGWHSNVVHVDLRVLKNILTSASLSAYAGIKKQDEMKLGDFIDENDKIDQEQIAEWEYNRNYYEEQLEAVKLMEQNIVEPLTAETSKPGFYMRGVEVNGKVGS